MVYENKETKTVGIEADDEIFVNGVFYVQEFNGGVRIVSINDL
jgi:hypothetical protein